MHSHPARDGLSIDQEGPRNSRSQEGGATKHGAPDYRVDRTTLQLTGPCTVSYEHGAGEWQTDYHFLIWFARAVCNDSQALERFLGRARTGGNGIKVMTSVPAWSHRAAVQLAKIMLHILKSSDLFKLCSRLARCDLDALLTYDVIEYCLCEHRRLVKRRHGKPLNMSEFVKSNEAESARVKAALASTGCGR